jgi:hypothetical protein
VDEWEWEELEIEMFETCRYTAMQRWDRGLHGLYREGTDYTKITATERTDYTDTTTEHTDYTIQPRECTRIIQIFTPRVQTERRLGIQRCRDAGIQHTEIHRDAESTSYKHTQ